MFGSLVVWGQSVLGFYVLVTREYGSIDWFFKYMETEVWVDIVFENRQTGISIILCMFLIDDLFLFSFISDLVFAFGVMCAFVKDYIVIMNPCDIQSFP